MGQVESTRKRKRHDVPDGDVAPDNRRGLAGQLAGFRNQDGRRPVIRRPFGQLSSSQPTTSSAAAVVTSQYYGVDENQLHIAPIDINLAGAAAALHHSHESIGEPSNSQDSQPNKIFKLEMSINTADGSINGNVLIGPAVLVDIPQHVCSDCHGQLDNLHSQDSQQGVGVQDLLSVEEMNQLYTNDEVHYLYRLGNDLLTSVYKAGELSCNEMVGLVDIRAKLKEQIFWRLERPDLFSGAGRFTTTGVALFGEDGDGKTTLAKLITAHVNHQYINVHPYYLDCTDKYKRLLGIFRLAREGQPSVIVFEAADQTFRQNKKLQQLFVTEFHTSVEQDNKIVIIATMKDCYHSLPHRVLECFEHRIRVPPPDVKERKELINLYMRGVKHSLKEKSLKELAELTRYFTRAKIVDLCRQASNLPVFEVPHEMFLHTLPSAIRPVIPEDFIKIIRGFETSPMSAIPHSGSSVTSNSSDETLVGMTDVNVDNIIDEIEVDEVD